MREAIRRFGRGTSGKTGRPDSFCRRSSSGRRELGVLMTAGLLLLSARLVQAQFTILHSFSGQDGADPLGSLTLSGSTLYGTTKSGGSNDKGTVFSLVIPEPSTAALMGVSLLGILAIRHRRRRNSQ